MTLAVEVAEPYGPFQRIPPGLHEHLAPYLDDIIEEVVLAVRTEIPEYARPADHTYMRVVQRGVEQALTDFVARMARTGTDSESIRATCQRIGRGEAEEGRSLDAFQAALRLGARVTWRRINALAAAGRLPAHAPAAFGEALFLHLDDMAAATTAGHTQARLHAAGEPQRRRSRLIELLTADPPASAGAISELAHTAQWPLPRDLAVVLVDQAPPAEAARPIMPPEFLARFDGQPGIIIVPDPAGPGRHQAIARALQGMRAAVGPTVAPTDCARSLQWAGDALALARRGILSGTGVVHCAEHLATLLLFRDESLVDAITERYLLPLEEVRSPQRERLAETLLCWLQCGHNASEVAVRLAVHPQTVRYRLRQLDEVFGDGLHDPAAQFEMQLALRARELRQGNRRKTLAG